MRIVRSSLWRAAALLFTAIIAVSHAAAPKPAGGLPPWLIGTWMPMKVYELVDFPYDLRDEPVTYFPGKPLVIALNRLTFTSFGCQGLTVTPGRGPFVRILRYSPAWPAHTPVSDYGMAPDSRPVDYLKISCSQYLADAGFGDGFQPVPGQRDTWIIVLRSHDVIEMPFYQHTYVVFRRVPAPTS